MRETRMPAVAFCLSVFLSASADAALASGSALDFGIAARGRIIMTGCARIEGVNDPGEADILSATYGSAEAVALTGNPGIDGDIFICNPQGYASITGYPWIGGQTSWDRISEHIHCGIGDVEFPQVDPTVFEPFATDTVDAATPTGGNLVFENIRVAAGTNPTFSGNTTVLGVMFIETPNRVCFLGNLALTGVIITEDAGQDAWDANTIRFQGNTSFRGVEDLPDSPQFDALRAMGGAAILAPGFSVFFAGNFGTISGAMAAERFVLSGNAGGTVCGPILSYGDGDLVLTGNAHLAIDRSRYPMEPPGFADGAPSWTPVGDADGDGDVDLEDFMILKRHFGTAAGADGSMGDFDGDGDVDLDDFALLKRHYDTGRLP
ncbi:MAG: hypothetical protein GX591_13655 [Planctomycetes bacterium]|nr:hypothetical protein [Planctomycetota bacterium]